MFSFGSLKLRRKQLFQGCFIQRYTSHEEVQNHYIRVDKFFCTSLFNRIPQVLIIMTFTVQDKNIQYFKRSYLLAYIRTLSI